MIILPFIILIAIGATSPLSLDPDFGWHLFLGSKMVETRQLITNLVGYNYFEPLYLPDHEWLSDILLYLFYTHSNYYVLALIFFTIITITFVLLYRCAKLRGATIYSTILALILATLPLRLTYGIRLQVLLLFGAALLLYIAQKATSYKKRLILYFFIFLVGNNLHGGFTTLAIIPIIFELAGFIDTRNQDTIRHSSAKKTLILSLVIITALSINPYGMGFWELALEYAIEGYYKAHIAEWLPIYYPPIHLDSVIFPLSLFIFLFTISGFWKKLKPHEYLILALLLFAGIKYKRLFTLFFIIGTPYLALAIDDFAAFAKIQTKKIKIATIILTIFILSVIAQAFLNINPGNSTGYPYEAAKFLKSANLPNGNFLNPYGWGGYLIWQNPEIPVFIDGRGPQLKINPKTTILQEENQFYSNDTAVIQEKLDHYNIGFVLTQKPIDKQHNFIDRFFWQMKGATTKTVEQHKNNLDNYLLSSPNWSLVYEDDISRVYFRQQ